MQFFHQSEKLILKWFKDDANYVREVCSYDLFERFGVWTAPQSSYCKLTIKVTGDAKAGYFGVYQMIEPVDETYLANRSTLFNNNSGNLWKANYGADLKNTSTAPDLMGMENITLTSNYTPAYDYKGKSAKLETAKSQLANFMTNVNSKYGKNLQSYLSGKMDVSLFLKTYAVNVILGMWDDYWSNNNNFYFYFGTDEKFYFIPYDYDNKFGTSFLMTDSGSQNPLEWGKNSENPLVAKVLSILEFKMKYIQY
ncbi:spore coat protein CotH [Chryseobacterium sp. MP_3.2]|nr:spore coat protein CotH [Chryseobacterium sp. MP_3.2]